ncbi:LOG family protein [Bremerella sp. T1]|uniref:LOG family protein n=1 Tax=Bremerella sp. TYQ1 TaxID=3119568 RepID=UPI001CCA25F9|nr:TIGR00730 family Rossman fold protein [Bremerella volcania]UBM37452.1 TIGR00730 family Rossman fold protein [Bremerella volcania]
MKSLCVFCGSASGSRPVYVEAATKLGQLMAERKLQLVYGGGKVGMMGALADAVLDAGGEVIGVIPGALVDRELAHHGVTDLIIVDSMHQRKAKMAESSDGFLALPGGYGTLEELFEVITWAQLGFHSKPCGLLNVENFFNPLLHMLDQAAQQQFMSTDNRDLLLTSNDAGEILNLLTETHPHENPRWIDRSET